MVTVDGAAGLWRGRTLGIMNPSSRPAGRVSPVRRIARTSRTLVLTSSQETVVTIGVIHLMLGRGEAVSGALFSARASGDANRIFKNFQILVVLKK